MTNVILTGLPRSGLAAVSALLDGLPDCISLNAPEWQRNRVARLQATIPYCKWLVGDFAMSRARLLRGEPIADCRLTDGTPLPDDELSAEPVRIAKPGLPRDFTLAVAQDLLFTALLPHLIPFDHFKMLAVVRNPVDTLMAWQQIPDQVMNREVFLAMNNFWPEAWRIAESQAPALDRMAQLYEACCQRYHESRSHVHVVKYEDVLDDPHLIGKWLGVREPSIYASLIVPRRRSHGESETAAIRDAMRKYGVFAKQFYS